jgi:hypothetical protein
VAKDTSSDPTGAPDTFAGSVKTLVTTGYGQLTEAARLLTVVYQAAGQEHAAPVPTLVRQNGAEAVLDGHVNGYAAPQLQQMHAEVARKYMAVAEARFDNALVLERCYGRSQYALDHGYREIYAAHSFHLRARLLDPTVVETVKPLSDVQRDLLLGKGGPSEVSLGYAISRLKRGLARQVDKGTRTSVWKEFSPREAKNGAADGPQTPRTRFGFPQVLPRDKHVTHLSMI